MSFAHGKTALFESEFESGRMEPWKTITGSWAVAGGALACQQSNFSKVAVAIDQKEALTLEVKAASIGGNPLYFDLILFADSTQGQYAPNAVAAMFHYSECTVQYFNNHSMNSVTSRNFNRQFNGGVMRFAYDPADGKVRVWLDGGDLGEYTIPMPPKQGKYLMLASHHPVSVSSVKLLRGIQPPGEDAGKADEAADVVRLANKDRVSAGQVMLGEDATVRAKTAYGELSFPVDKVSAIVFRTQGQEKPKAEKGAVLVETAGSRFTLKFAKLTGEFLVGTAEYLGEVKVKRETVKRVVFKARPEAAATGGVVPRPPVANF